MLQIARDLFLSLSGLFEKLFLISMDCPETVSMNFSWVYV